MNMNKQIEIPGIGQQKMTLDMWKSKNGIYTQLAHHLEPNENPWCCWDEIVSPHDFIHEYGADAFGYGRTEKEAIINFCQKYELKIPFWWKE